MILAAIQSRSRRNRATLCQMDSSAPNRPAPTALAVNAVSPAGAAEISGLDLSQPLEPAQIAAIKSTLVDNPVLICRDQSLTKDQQTRFSACFGKLEGHIGKLSDGSTFPTVHTLTNLDADGNLINTDVAKLNWFWHTDKSYHAVPAFVTILHAIDVPPTGGDTQFCNARLAYDALPPDRKARIDCLDVVHDWAASRINSGTSPATEEQKRARPPVTHPLVRTHPDSGQKSLYLGVHASHVVGLSKPESSALLAELTDHIGQESFVYTHRWRQGDVVMWDNRCLLHRALPNYEFARFPRILNRTVIVGTKPY